jgi:hypothetical protein
MLICPPLLCSPKAIREYASKMIGSSLITAQTGPEGQPCKQVRARAARTRMHAHTGTAFARDLLMSINYP